MQRSHMIPDDGSVWTVFIDGAKTVVSNGMEEVLAGGDISLDFC